MRILPYLLFIVFLAACEQSIDWELEPAEQSRLVVEAILTNENQVQEILLSQTYPELNGMAPQVTDALVQVTANETTYDFLPDPEAPGRYVSESPFRVVAGRDYQLRIEWQGVVYTASSRLSAPVLPIPTPVFVEVPDTDSLKLGNFIPVFSTNEQALYRIDIDWRHIPDTVELQQARLYFYTFSSLDMSQLIPPPRETLYFPRGSKVAISKFGLDDAFAEYLRAKAIETDWSGSFFFSVSDNLPTNISEDGLGFFSVCEVVRDSLVAE